MSTNTCEYCNKVLSNKYNLKIHQQNTKSCITLRHDTNLDKSKFVCEYCDKFFTANSSLKSHTNICKKFIEFKKEKLLQKEIEIKLEEEKIKIRKELEAEYKLKIKEKKSRKRSSTTIIENHTINNNINNIINNNHTTIFTSMTPERVKDTFDKYYTIETLMGGQKSLADFVMDNFVRGKGGMIYLCTDRARKKVFYTTDFSDMKEDVNCETLISHMTPAYPIIKDKVELSEYEKKYVPYVDKIHESYDDILAIHTDGITFRSQICRLLPSSISDKEHMDFLHIPIKSLEELRVTEEKQFVERKEEVEKYIKHTNEIEIEMEEPN